MTKHTGSALVVLLVGLLVSFTSYASHIPLMGTPSFPAVKECVSAEQHIAYVKLKNPETTSKVLAPSAVKTFKFNYNKVPPASNYNITGVVLTTKPRANNYLIAILINGCISFAAPITHDKMKELMAPTYYI